MNRFDRIEQAEEKRNNPEDSEVKKQKLEDEFPDDVVEDESEGEFPDDVVEDDDDGEFPDDVVEDEGDGEFPDDGVEDDEESNSENLSIEEKQKMADETAQRYNDRFRPYDRAMQKGIDDVTKTDNGGVSFENSDAIYTNKDGNKVIVRIEATGNRTSDFNAANKAAGLNDKPDGYVWHHVDDYDVKTNTFTLQLVKEDVHNATKPHSGGCAQYDAVHGPSYNPPRKDVG